MLLPLLLRSPWPFAFGASLAQDLSFAMFGLCGRIGLLCTLIPGETARRLIKYGSKSSSRLRLFTRRAKSLAEDGNVARGVEDLDRDLLKCRRAGLSSEDPGVSIGSSLIADEFSR